ncbi:MAG: hypothetical protein N2039_03225, partial [Gemmataceae bacterium]|nr:hypothetical protein [Gemmataceae bacterium]
MSQERGAGGEEFIDALGGAPRPALSWSGRRRAAILERRIPESEELGRERKSLQGYGQGRQVQILALVLEVAAVDQPQFAALFEVDQIRVCLLYT